ncbi:MAG TPA: chemotaxis protein CheX [Chloroflexi bacterium]|jgi:chemotaxis protein CheX|nr:chemotaxis protein CheX [Chloroflexota bacterium]
MKSKFLNPFLIAAASVFEQEVGVKVSRGRLSIQRGGYISDDVTVLVSLVGRVEGSVLFGMSYNTAKRIVSEVLGQEFERFDELAQSGIAELANVISGLSSTKLAEVGYRSIISVPMLIIGKGSRISTPDIERLIVPMGTPLGEVELSLILRDNPQAPEQFESLTTKVSALTL